VPAYADELSVREARERYFAANGLDASGYEDDWVRLRVGPIPVVFPNTAGRKAAVPCHDLHHVATGYATDLVGEAEIGAWEIASGCTGARAALVLNLLVIWPVLFFAPGRVYRAFLRGRHGANLYDLAWDETRLDRPVAALRAELGIGARAPAARAADRVAFAAWIAVVVGLQLVLGAALVAGPLWAVLRCSGG
jgi:hypothetical protein